MPNVNICDSSQDNPYRKVTTEAIKTLTQVD